MLKLIVNAFILSAFNTITPFKTYQLKKSEDKP